MRRVPSLSDLASIRELRQYLRGEGPFDLIHCHSTKAGIVGRLSAAGLPVKSVYTPHGFFTMDHSNSAFARRVAARTESLLSKMGDGVLVISQTELAHALGIGISAARLRFISNGVALTRVGAPPTDRISVCQEIGAAPDGLLVGFIGRLFM